MPFTAAPSPVRSPIHAFHSLAQEDLHPAATDGRRDEDNDSVHLRGIFRRTTPAEEESGGWCGSRHAATISSAERLGLLPIARSAHALGSGCPPSIPTGTQVPVSAPARRGGQRWSSWSEGAMWERNRRAGMSACGCEWRPAAALIQRACHSFRKDQIRRVPHISSLKSAAHHSTHHILPSHLFTSLPLLLPLPPVTSLVPALPPLACVAAV
jgi:hypothetical protein